MPRVYPSNFIASRFIYPFGCSRDIWYFGKKERDVIVKFYFLEIDLFCNF